MSIRSFIAIKIPPSLGARLADLPRQAGGLSPSIRWVSAESIHLTLKFLGEILPEQIGPIVDQMREAARGIEPLSLSATHVGAFPNEDRPRVIWVGLAEESGDLSRLQKEIEKRLQKLGFPREEKGFTPHLTLGRARSLPGRKGSLSPVIQALDAAWKGGEDSFTVDRFYLMKSELRPGGAVYSVLEEVLLAPEGSP
ncbi:MAG: RNA 2',3'-cyclic phosphodiesterase [Candidatus Tectomicrobia bacterium]|uniref:RNA 2',3'-cyclic phosphodiesterase n=1 Tax=Tectimicrobiota bacterium TaxID=2528274 RepID=A0A932CRC7_UNCTE|nr:RNA 2',3'-cyclic phosphodiesterase [Candidatus Tectomicrobia bacterium]